MARRLANAFLLCWGAALYLWYRRNAVTLMRRGKGPLATPAADLPSQGLTTPAPRLICRFFR
jgi:hypothetical protein